MDEKEDFRAYLYGRWFIGATATSWKLTKNPTMARIGAERAGERIFNELFGGAKKWTTKSWAEVAENDFHKQLGSQVKFEVGESSATMRMLKCPFEDVMRTDRYAACSFHYGTWRGLFRKAFPDGELLLPSVISKGAPECPFKFITKASEDERMLAMKHRRDLFSI